MEAADIVKVLAAESGKSCSPGLASQYDIAAWEANHAELPSSMAQRLPIHRRVDVTTASTPMRYSRASPLLSSIHIIRDKRPKRTIGSSVHQSKLASFHSACNNSAEWKRYTPTLINRSVHIARLDQVRGLNRQNPYSKKQLFGAKQIRSVPKSLTKKSVEECAEMVKAALPQAPKSKFRRKITREQFCGFYIRTKTFGA